MKKKISFIINGLRRSGAERVLFSLACYCLKLGYDVEIVMLLYHEVEFDIPEGIKVVDLAGSTTSRAKRLPYWLKSLKRYFKERKPDVVVSFIVRVNVLTLLSVKDKNIKVIVSERNDPRNDSRTKPIKMLVNKLYPKADYIVFQTEAVKKLFKKKIQDKGIVIPNPIRVTEYADLDKYDDNLITYAGRYDEQKDVATIINAAEIVTKHNPNVRFELYGTGHQKEMLTKLAIDKGLSNNVFVNDNIPNIVEKMRDSKFFVMSSLYEGMSNALMEASFGGVPCLTTPVLGTDFIKEGINGYFYNFKDSEALAKLIINAYEDKEKYKSLRQNSIELAKSIKRINVFDEWLKLF